MPEENSVYFAIIILKARPDLHFIIAIRRTNLKKASDIEQEKIYSIYFEKFNDHNIDYTENTWLTCNWN